MIHGVIRRGRTRLHRYRGGSIQLATAVLRDTGIGCLTKLVMSDAKDTALRVEDLANHQLPDRIIDLVIITLCDRGQQRAVHLTAEHRGHLKQVAGALAESL